jgi:DNA-binding response OmpR family regulator
VQLGAAEILAKPTHLEDLFTRLADLLNGQQTLKTTQSVR